MTQPQTVTGFFDNIAEAQQAVQGLLGCGFRADQIVFSTQKEGGVTGDRQATTLQERNSGRFLRSLFGNTTDGGSDASASDEAAEEPSRGTTTVVTIQVQSPSEADQAVDLLKEARAVHISKPGE